MSQALIASLFPDDVTAEESWGSDTLAGLHPEEEALTSSMSTKRYIEFAAGRCCARRALSKLGVYDTPILVQPDRAPIWPTGIVGSISHTEGYVGAAVARNDGILGIGLDAEVLGTVDPDVWRFVCTEEEVSWLRSLDSGEKHTYSYLIFSAKECTYKCWCSATKQRLGFHDLRIVIDVSHQRFRAEFLLDEGNRFRKGASLLGTYGLHMGYVFTGMTLRAAHLRSILAPNRLEI